MTAKQQKTGRIRRKHICAVIPAAGFSSRMKSFKPLLPLGPLSMVESVISLFKTFGADPVIVVTGHCHGQLTAKIENAGGIPVFNPDYAQGMFSSICTGLKAVPKNAKGFFLIPVDIPAVRPGTLESLFSVFQSHPDKLIIPRFETQPGHPPLIPARVIPRILAHGRDGILRDILLDDPERIVRLPVFDRGILMDSDTPRAYEAVKNKVKNLDIPDTEECLSIIDKELANAPDVPVHLKKVATVAQKLGRAAAESIPCLNLDLICSAALLHDIKRNEKHHAEKGGMFLKSLGFGAVARIVQNHMTLTPGPVLDETQIVYFADKLCEKDRVNLDYPIRFIHKIKTHPHAEKEIRFRLETAQHIHARIEAAAGRSVRQILEQ